MPDKELFVPEEQEEIELKSVGSPIVNLDDIGGSFDAALAKEKKRFDNLKGDGMKNIADNYKKFLDVYNLVDGNFSGTKFLFKSIGEKLDYWRHSSDKNGHCRSLERKSNPGEYYYHFNLSGYRGSGFDKACYTDKALVRHFKFNLALPMSQDHFGIRVNDADESAKFGPPSVSDLIKDVSGYSSDSINRILRKVKVHIDFINDCELKVELCYTNGADNLDFSVPLKSIKEDSMKNFTKAVFSDIFNDRESNIERIANSTLGGYNVVV